MCMYSECIDFDANVTKVHSKALPCFQTKGDLLIEDLKMNTLLSTIEKVCLEKKY